MSEDKIRIEYPNGEVIKCDTLVGAILKRDGEMTECTNIHHGAGNGAEYVMLSKTLNQMVTTVLENVVRIEKEQSEEMVSNVE